MSDQTLPTLRRLTAAGAIAAVAAFPLVACDEVDDATDNDEVEDVDDGMDDEDDALDDEDDALDDEE
ncbi:DNA primase [Lipingzhangella sp. LS1_29]|uniref:DNA primase n=1 Tax=Lipingzhangella rawalii TaxID=2055835 RepID=A0ABU2H0L1_9ACTN|nr:DNA primase [Lipingzhangella rawalii]MDS1268838.1 DNA primase [Lipingzhangella rawalii]